MLKFQRSQDLDELISPTHAVPSVASFFISTPIKSSMALQTQVTECVQSLHTWLQELEAEVAQI
jgi:hypothetical protein